MAGLDTSQAPRGVLAAQRLVEGVAEQGDLAERHYLGLKSTLDLSANKGKEKIAKFILGAENRMPETAAPAFVGYAVVLIGVSAGSVFRMSPVEIMDIAQTEPERQMTQKPSEITPGRSGYGGSSSDRVSRASQSFVVRSRGGLR